MALYRILVLDWEKDKAINDLEKIWKPDNIWQSFIERQLTHMRTQKANRQNKD